MPVMLGVILAYIQSAFRRSVWLTCIPLSTYGDYYFTSLGFLLTLLGTLLAALKTIYTNILQSSSTTSTAPRSSSHFLVPPPLHLHPLDLLTRMSPLAFVQCVGYAYYSGELARLGTAVTERGATLSGWWYLLLLVGNGCIAFGLNVVSFTANGWVGALNMTVAGEPIVCVHISCIGHTHCCAAYSEHQAGFDHSGRRCHLRPHYHSHERAGHPRYYPWRGMVRVGRVRREAFEEGGREERRGLILGARAWDWLDYLTLSSLHWTSLDTQSIDSDACSLHSHMDSYSRLSLYLVSLIHLSP